MLDGETILGEVENLSDGLSGSFALTLEKGEYTLYCPGGDEEKRHADRHRRAEGRRTAPKSKPRSPSTASTSRKNTAELVAATEPFVAAVIAGNVAKAKALYPAARIPYERIEPVAESFGDLDPRIDARENDVPAERIRAASTGSRRRSGKKTRPTGMAPFAKQLLADVEELQAKVKNVELQAVQIANGANELLGEVSASKITGEEERYSHIDLVDFEANVEGAEAPSKRSSRCSPRRTRSWPRKSKPTSKTSTPRSKPYRRGDGFVLYTDLTKADTRKLAQEIDALAEELSQVPAQIVS